MLKIFILLGLFFQTQGSTLGGIEDMNIDLALNISKNTLQSLQSQENCSSRNGLICSFDVISVSKATVQTVQGFIYHIYASTTKGELEMQLWLQVAPRIASLHKFAVNGNDLIDNVKYFDSNDIVSHAISLQYGIESY